MCHKNGICGAYASGATFPFPNKVTSTVCWNPGIRRSILNTVEGSSIMVRSQVPCPLRNFMQHINPLCSLVLGCGRSSRSILRYANPTPVVASAINVSLWYGDFIMT